MSWFHKLLPSSLRLSSRQKKDIPQGLWSRCPSCEKMLFNAELDRQLKVCTHCDYHFPLSPKQRSEQLLSKVYSMLFEEILPCDPLKFKDTKKYKDRLKQSSESSTSSEALVCYHGLIEKLDVILVAFDFQYIGGSMGSVVGERFALACEKAIELDIPLICVASSGGARMQESLHSLMQMSKTAQAVAQLELMQIPYLVVQASPCMGGVSASLASLGDITIAEPQALVGFAGPRVISQTVREKLPKNFQKSEVLLEKGAIDMIVHRKDLKAKIHEILTSLIYYKAS